MAAPLLDVQNLTVTFASGPSVVTAVNDVSFVVRDAQIVGIPPS